MSEQQGFSVLRFCILIEGIYVLLGAIYFSYTFINSPKYIELQHKYSNASFLGAFIATFLLLIVYAIVLFGLWRGKKWAFICFIAYALLTALSSSATLPDRLDLLLCGIIIGLASFSLNLGKSFVSRHLAEV